MVWSINLCGIINGIWYMARKCYSFGPEGLAYSDGALELAYLQAVGVQVKLRTRGAWLTEAARGT